jgi:FtsH-binding integral membrane protein
MSDFDRNVTAASYDRPLSRAEAAVIDQGLRAYMLQIYNYMTLGLAITGFVALGVFMLSVTGDPAAAARTATGTARVAGGMYLTQFGYTLFVSPLKWVVILAPLGMVFLLSYAIQRMRTMTAHMMFWIFAALMGMSLSTIFLVYTQTSIARVFFIAAASFGGLSLWGYTTQRDISGWGAFLYMGVIGLVLAMLVNLVLGAFGVASGMMQFIISVVGVLVFAGLTAYDTQRLKSEYIYGRMEGEVAERTAIMGALSLYLNFINLFTFLLQLLGQRDE